MTIAPDENAGVEYPFLTILAFLADQHASIDVDNPVGTADRQKKLQLLLNVARKKIPDQVRRLEQYKGGSMRDSDYSHIVESIRAAIGDNLGMQLLKGETVH